MPWMMMTCCACGHQDDIDLFCCTPVCGPLPQSTYQCPHCGYAIERRFGSAKLHPTGWVEPGKVDLVPVPSKP